jgi:hypothetical protein
MTDNAIARAMFDNDLASKALGIEIVELSDGYAKTAMTVNDQMVNGHGITHGGYVFIVADDIDLPPRLGCTSRRATYPAAHRLVWSRASHRLHGRDTRTPRHHRGRDPIG